MKKAQEPNISGSSEKTLPEFEPLPPSCFSQATPTRAVSQASGGGECAFNQLSLPFCRPCHPSGRGRAGGEPGQHLGSGHGMQNPWRQPTVWDLEAKFLGEPVAGRAALVQAVPEWAEPELEGMKLGLGSWPKGSKVWSRGTQALWVKITWGVGLMQISGRCLRLPDLESVGVRPSTLSFEHTPQVI